MWKIASSGLLIGFLSSASFAHHSFGMFDFDPESEMLLEGVVKEWQFVNPHSWLIVTVTNEDGTQTDWSFESGTVPQLVQRGITFETYQPGDQVRVVAGPVKDGRPGGMMKFVQHEDGTCTMPIQTGGPRAAQEAIDRWSEQVTCE